MSTSRWAILIVALAGVLRLAHLGSESFWFDEVVIARLSTAGLDSTVEQMDLGRPGLYLLLSQLTARLFGTGELAARALSAGAGTLAVALLIPVGARLFGREVGLLAAFLMACSEFNIHYSQEHRYYALLTGLAVLSMWSYLRLLHSWRRRDLALYVLASAALFHTHPMALSIIIVQNVAVLSSPRRSNLRWGAWSASQLLLLIAMLPVLVKRWLLIHQGHPGPSWIGAPSLETPFSTLWRFFYSIREGSGLWAMVPVLLAVVFVDTALRLRGWRPAQRGTWRADVRASVAQRRSELLLVALWLLLPILILFVASHAFKPVYVDRYLIGSSPALYLTLAFVAWAARRQVALPTFIAAYLAMAGPVLAGYYETPRKEQWRELAEYVSLADRKGDAVVFLSPDDLREGQGTVAAFYWYYDGWGEPCLLREARSAEGLYSALEECLAGAPRFWLVERDTIAAAESRRFFERTAPPGFSLIGGRHFTYVRTRLFVRDRPDPTDAVEVSPK